MTALALLDTRVLIQRRRDLTAARERIAAEIARVDARLLARPDVREHLAAAGRRAELIAATSGGYYHRRPTEESA